MIIEMLAQLNSQVSKLAKENEELKALLKVKCLELPDGAVYLYTKDEDKNGICEQAPPIQEGISTTEGTK
jgi:hypothetical protein